jgi:hypothetical protein
MFTVCVTLILQLKYTLLFSSLGPRSRRFGFSPTVLPSCEFRTPVSLLHTFATVLYKCRRVECAGARYEKLANGKSVNVEGEK